MGGVLLRKSPNFNIFKWFEFSLERFWTGFAALDMAVFTELHDTRLAAAMLRMRMGVMGRFMVSSNSEF